MNKERYSRWSFYSDVFKHVHEMIELDFQLLGAKWGDNLGALEELSKKLGEAISEVKELMPLLYSDPRLEEAVEEQVGVATQGLSAALAYLPGLTALRELER